MFGFVGGGIVGVHGSGSIAVCGRRRHAVRICMGKKSADVDVSGGEKKEGTVESIDSMIERVETLKQEALTSLKEASDLRELDRLRVSLLGKKGSLSSVLKSVGKLAPEDRPKLGQVVNKAKADLEELIPNLKDELEVKAFDAQMEEEWVDVTQPGLLFNEVGYRHPLIATLDRTVSIFSGLGYDIIDDPVQSPEIETDWFNFEALNTPPDHPARDMQDTYYLTEDKKNLLRTHTSAVQIRYMTNNKPPFKICAPGRVYRRDAVDATHTALFHQIEILNLQKKGEVHLGHLKGTVIYFLQQFFGDDVEVRFRGSYFPFTEPSLEVDVFFRGKWLEVLGCGMVDPRVLENCDIDPEEWSGFAAGFGAERFAMVTHQIPDIREFYKNDTRFLNQFTGLNIE
uniref:Phenylalanine--tRNA ligase alpha subunit n=3 Tax=Rhodosorus marinus TaxID=101924 RepID=A0A7S3EN39_9RHOD|mmetsp:Transcript_7551/g.33666  ORF Transcript_7551/g.33666 Transcript_7551/m.33666 type:complete len:399 (+) Transcript_7551:373-1569(+)|eukprot:CAMPEP_0113967684 /NCGR_PEP_ID=MMETSP0011_2-20120614/9081_1 /TAXON_ID=101924 /ORGANISM="Rhodosorus marinus" /LENGTH=398 /DNA_ID=CAMNT_0000980623 /DNA_START=297 /DNA_END=1493 /DNA_ORIENTATION=- /assembly_acc=CAM_ASM_000156